MNSAGTPTRYARWTRRQALVLVAVAAVALGWCLRVAVSPVPHPASPSPTSNGDHHVNNDLDLYRDVVRRVHAGEGYYDVLASEFQKYHYPARSVFNYRTPVYAWVIGKLPHPAWGQAILAVLAVAAMLLAYTAVQPEAGAVPAGACVVLMAGALAWCLVDGAFLGTELWSGTLIALSVGASAHGRRKLGWATGLIALFFRELALPYCGVAGALAWWQGRRRELAAWLAGLALYAVFMAFHARQVLPRITHGGGTMGLAHWIQFGGIRFILETCRMNLILFACPTWVGAIYLVLSLLGLAGWRGETGTRSGLVVGAYLAIFAVVGAPDDGYWGQIYAPLVPFGMAWAPAAIRDLGRTILRPSPATLPPAAV